MSKKKNSHIALKQLAEKTEVTQHKLEADLAQQTARRDNAKTHLNAMKAFWAEQKSLAENKTMLDRRNLETEFSNRAAKLKAECHQLETEYDLMRGALPKIRSDEEVLRNSFSRLKTEVELLSESVLMVRSRNLHSVVEREYLSQQTELSRLRNLIAHLQAEKRLLEEDTDRAIAQRNYVEKEVNKRKLARAIKESVDSAKTLSSPLLTLQENMTTVSTVQVPNEQAESQIPATKSLSTSPGFSDGHSKLTAKAQRPVEPSSKSVAESSLEARVPKPLPQPFVHSVESAARLYKKSNSPTKKNDTLTANRQGSQDSKKGRNISRDIPGKVQTREPPPPPTGMLNISEKRSSENAKSPEQHRNRRNTMGLLFGRAGLPPPPPSPNAITNKKISSTQPNISQINLNQTMMPSTAAPNDEHERRPTLELLYHEHN